MTNKSQQSQQLQYPLELLNCLFYPKYQPNCNSQEFLTQYEPLFQELRKLDQISESQIKRIKIALKNQEKDQEGQLLVFYIIQQLNNLCTFCHRKQLRIKITHQVSCYKKNLLNLAIGKRPIKISSWQCLKLGGVPQSNSQLLKTFDMLYLTYQRIPSYYLLLLQQPQTLISLYDFQSKLILDNKSDKTSIPLVHKYFLGVVAASTYGARYLWNFMVKRFLEAGGQVTWIVQGLEQTPKYIREFAEISYRMAYNFKVASLQTKCQDLGLIVQDAKILQGLYLLSYFQFLACLTLVCGLIPQSTQYQQYLPHIPYLQPSLQSFETMKKASKTQFAYQKQMAKQFQQMYSWDVSSDKEIIKRVQISKFKRCQSENKQKINQSIKIFKYNSQGISKLDHELQNKIGKSQLTIGKQSSNRLRKQSFNKLNKQPFNKLDKQTFNKLDKQGSQQDIKVSIDDQEIFIKIKNSHTMKNIQNIFSKYVPFDQRLSNVQFKVARQPKSQSLHPITQQIWTQNSSVNSASQVYSFIYASQWNFTQHACPLIQSIMDPSFQKCLTKLLSSLSYLQQSKSKNLKIYYQSLQNYMYQYVSYVTLINENLEVVERNYIKLLTRSPFLFNQKSFNRMSEDLETQCGVIQPLGFCLQVFKFKLEHSFCITSYVFNRYLQNRE